VIPAPRDGANRKERRYLRYASAGTQLGIVVVLFTLGGYWLDGKIPSMRPLFTILGAVLGAVGGMTSLVMQVSRIEKRK